MQSNKTYVSLKTEPMVENALDCIAVTNKEIINKTTIFIRLIKILRSDRITPTPYIKIAQKIGKKLQYYLELWNLYNRNMKEETLTYNEELESVLKDKDLLIVRMKIDDICEKEYDMKLSVANWDAENLNFKILHLEKNMRNLNCLSDLIEAEDAEEIKRLVQNEFQTIKDLELGNEVSEMLINNISTIAKIIS
jgi:hypothetical protein